MAELVALDLPGGPEFVAELRRAWDRGDAVLPLDPRAPDSWNETIVAALRPGVVVSPGGVRSERPDGLAVEAGDAVVIATSGTTGAPKGVVLTRDALESAAHASAAYLGIAADTCWLACLPLSHIGGFSVVTRALLADADLIVHPSFDPAAVEQAARDGVTHVSLVPTALGRVDASLFRTILLGGSSIPRDRPANTVATYGMTESGAGVVYDGLPLNGVGLRIDDDGHIALRGPTMLRCYRDGTDPKDASGWYRTGDVGSVDPTTGLLTVEGRADDLIITGGEKVWPGPVEAVISTLDGVADVAVAGRPDPEWGQRVVAFVVPRHASTPPSLDDVRDAVKAVMPPWCAPKQLTLVAAVPRTAIGKVRRNDLA